MIHHPREVGEAVAKVALVIGQTQMFAPVSRKLSRSAVAEWVQWIAVNRGDSASCSVNSAIGVL
jgi:hypothetical protein